jgi:hypothetical protein
VTPRERAEEVCRLFGIARRPEQDSGSQWGPGLCARIEKAIRSAEAAAYERAARECDALAEKTRNETRKDAIWMAADKIRALATKEE